jgi:isochorismate synthase
MLQSAKFNELPIHGKLSSKKQDAYVNFLEKACSSQKTSLIYLTFPVKCVDPLRWFHHHTSAYRFHFYWETPSQSSAIAALGTARRLSFSGGSRFNALENGLQKADSEITTFNFSGQAGKQPPRWVGGFSFFPEIGPTIWDGFQPTCFTLPELGMIQEKEQTTGFISIETNKTATPEALHQDIAGKMQHFDVENIKNIWPPVSNAQEDFINDETPKDEFQRWSGIIQEAKMQFDTRKLEKVVLTRMNRLSLNKSRDPVQTLFQLRGHYPGGCSFLIKNEHSHTFLGCSPELLLSARDHSVNTEALAGSIARGKNGREDEILAGELLASSKDQKEHAFVVQSIREELSPFLTKCDVPDQPVIKKLPSVQHLYTPVRGEMNKSATTLRLLEKLHPTPAVGGTPRARALSFIRDHELFERGWFAGPIGWISSSGQAGFYVALRSGLVNEKQALLFAGCGIVSDSDPKAEWEEANLKFKPMRLALKHE